MSEDQVVDQVESSEEVDINNDVAAEVLQAEIEAEARRFGKWVPKEEFKGNPKDWVDAETFVRRGKEINPILRKHNDELKAEIKAERERVSQLKAVIDTHDKMFKEMKQNAIDRAISELRAEKKLARADGEHDVVDEIEDRIKELTEQKKDAKVEKSEQSQTKQVANPEGQRIFEEWKDESSYFGKDDKLTRAAEAFGLVLGREHPELLGTKAFLKLVDAEMKDQFPEKFTNKLRERGSGVGSGGDSSVSKAAGGKKGQTYNDLPAEAKNALKSLERQGITPKEKEDYIRIYFENESKGRR